MARPRKCPYLALAWNDVQARSGLEDAQVEEIYAARLGSASKTGLRAATRYSKSLQYVVEGGFANPYASEEAIAVVLGVALRRQNGERIKPANELRKFGRTGKPARRKLVARAFPVGFVKAQRIDRMMMLAAAGY